MAPRPAPSASASDPIHHRPHTDDWLDALPNKRNGLLHCTWFFGFPSLDNPESARFFVCKFKNAKAGLSKAEWLPKDADELKQLGERCTEVRDWLGRMELCLVCELKIAAAIRTRGGTWIMTDPPGTQRTLKWYDAGLGKIKVGRNLGRPNDPTRFLSQP